MNDDARKIVKRTTITTVVLGVVLSPIPLADEIVFIPIFGGMALRIGRTHGLSTRTMPWKPIAVSTLSALLARAAANVTVSYLPGVAAVANATSAAAVTQLLGSYIDKACEDPSNAKPLTVRDVAERLRDFVTRRTTTAT